MKTIIFEKPETITERQSYKIVDNSGKVLDDGLIFWIDGQFWLSYSGNGKFRKQVFKKAKSLINS